MNMSIFSFLIMLLFTVTGFAQMTRVNMKYDTLGTKTLLADTGFVVQGVNVTRILKDMGIEFDSVAVDANGNYHFWKSGTSRLQSFELDSSFFNLDNGVLTIQDAAFTAGNGLDKIGRNFGQKIIKNIATLQAYDADSLGTTVYLKEVATGGYGGGEMVYADSTDLKTRIGSAVVDTVVIFHAPTTDRVWYRKDADMGFINVEWAGAKGDNSNDDTDEIQNAVNKSILLGLDTFIPKGVFKITSPITVTPGNNVGYRFYGNGTEVSKISVGSASNGISVTGNQDNIIFENFQIAKATDVNADTGLALIGNHSGIVVRNVIISGGFKYAIVLDLGQDCIFDNVKGTGNLFGFYSESFSNGNVIRSGGFESDSIGYILNACHGVVLEGLDMGNQPVSLKLENISTAEWVGGQLESHTKAPWWIQNNCVLDVYGGRSQGNSASVLAFMEGSSKLRLFGHETTGFRPDSTFHLTSTSPKIQWFGRGNVAPAYAYIETSGQELPVYSDMDVRRIIDFGSTTPSRGQIVALEPYLSGDTTNVQSRLVFGQQTGASVRKNFLTDGNDWRYDANSPDSSALGGRIDMLRFIPFIGSGTTSAGDSTVMFLYSDTLGISTFLGVMGTVDRTSPDGTPLAAFISQSVTTTARGRHRILIWHPWDTAGGISFRVNGLLIIQAKTTGNW